MSRHSLRSSAPPRRLVRLDILLVIIVFAVAVFFRLWQFNEFPPGMDFDEAFESLEARQILSQPEYHPIFFPGNNGVPPLKIYLTALAFLVIGEQTLAIRYVSVVVGVVTVMALYLLVRTLLPEAANAGEAAPQAGPSPLARRFLPFAASLILAVLPWHNTFSRRGVEVILLPLWAVLSILFLWQGLRTGKWWHFALSGLFWGSTFYTYQAAWFLPGVLALFLVYKTIQERGFLRRYAGRLLILALVAILAVLPLASFFYHNPGVIAARSTQVAILGEGDAGGPVLLNVVRNALKVAGLFAFGGDGNVADNIYKEPPLSLALMLSLIVGLLVALFRFKRAEYALLLLWFAWMLVPSALTTDAPSIRRAVGSAPPLAILIALGMAWLFDAVRSLASRHALWQKSIRATATLALTALLIHTVVWSYQYYFIRFPNVKEIFQDFDVGLNALGRYADSTPIGTHLYYTPAVAPGVLHLPVTWQVRDRDLHAFDGRQGLVLGPSGPQASLYLITVYRGDSDTLPALQTFYPTGRVVDSINNPYGVLHSLAFAVEPNTAPILSIQNPAHARFEDDIELLGSDFSGSELHAGEPFTLTLFWRATAGPTSMSHTVFTHLLGSPKADGNTVWAGHDGPPLGDTYPTTRWGEGEIIVDRHVFTIPPDAPAGVYQIEAGLYTPQNGGRRLHVLDTSGAPQGDNVLLGSVILR